MKIAIASDHGGYHYKQILAAYLREKGHTVQDFGCHDENSVDYADFAIPAGEAVAAGQFERGILICGTGIGMSIAANKVRGVRCALCSEPVSARLTREHNNTNVLAMGERVIGIEMAKAIVDVWLETPFTGGRHQRRIGKISAYETSARMDKI